MVMGWHLPKVDGYSIVGPIGDLGIWGVDLFFVLSGFLIANQLFKNLRDGDFSFRTFYLRRLLRTWPNYFFVLLLYLLIPAFREKPTTPPLWKFLTFTQNFGLRFGAFSHAWSLCIEEQFYLVLPLVMFVLWKIRRRDLALGLAAFAILFGMVLRGMLWLKYVAPFSEPSEAYWRMIYYPTWGRLDGLILGVLMAAFRNFFFNIWAFVERNGNRILLAGVVVLAVGLALLQYYRFELLSIVFGYPILSLGFALILTSAISANSMWNRVKVPGARIGATLSFSLYLLHKQMFHLCELFLGGLSRVNTGAFVFVSFVVSFVAASALYFIVERPFLRVRDRVAAI